MPDELKKTQRRAYQYFYVDGSFELGFGLMCLLLAAYFFMEKRLEGTWLSALLSGSLVLVFIGGAALIRWLVSMWKQRITYPRTGYVAYRQDGRLKRGWRIALALAVGGLMGAGVAIMVLYPPGNLDLMPLVSGLLMGLVLIILAWRTSVPRFNLLAIFTALAGVGLAFANFGNDLGIAIFYLTLGAMLVFSGLFTLFIYLRRNPLPPEEIQ
jgi:hypothetical protein